MMCKESYEAIDEGSLSLGLIRLAIPIALSGMLQQLFNSVDVAVIGRFAGGLALAAVGANAANVSLFVMLLTGLSVGPNVLIARLIGAKEKEEISESVHTAILFSILFGLGIMVGGQLLSEALMDWMHTPGEIADGAILYFRIYLLGLPFIALYNFCASILRCIGDSKRPLYTLFASRDFECSSESRFCSSFPYGCRWCSNCDGIVKCIFGICAAGHPDEGAGSDPAGCDKASLENAVCGRNRKDWTAIRYTGHVVFFIQPVYPVYTQRIRRVCHCRILYRPDV